MLDLMIPASILEDSGAEHGSDIHSLLTYCQLACCLRSCLIHLRILANTSADMAYPHSLNESSIPTSQDPFNAIPCKEPGIPHSLSGAPSTASIGSFTNPNPKMCNECEFCNIDTVGWVHFDDAEWSGHHPNTNLRCFVNFCKSKFLVRKSAGCSSVLI